MSRRGEEGRGVGILKEEEEEALGGQLGPTPKTEVRKFFASLFACLFFSSRENGCSSHLSISVLDILKMHSMMLGKSRFCHTIPNSIWRRYGKTYCQKTERKTFSVVVSLPPFEATAVQYLPRAEKEKEEEGGTFSCCGGKGKFPHLPHPISQISRLQGVLYLSPKCWKFQ